MNDIPWKPGETYRTRGGREARVYATDAGGVFPIHGAVKCGAEWINYVWREDGGVASGFTSASDLMPPTRVRYVNVYPGAGYRTRELADKAAEDARIACVRVEFQLGQFDE